MCTRWGISSSLQPLCGRNLDPISHTADISITHLLPAASAYECFHKAFTNISGVAPRCDTLLPFSVLSNVHLFPPLPASTYCDFSIYTLICFDALITRIFIEIALLVVGWERIIKRTILGFEAITAFLCTFWTRASSLIETPNLKIT